MNTNKIKLAIILSALMSLPATSQMKINTKTALSSEKDQKKRKQENSHTARLVPSRNNQIVSKVDIFINQPRIIELKCDKTKGCSIELSDFNNFHSIISNKAILNFEIFKQNVKNQLKLNQIVMRQYKITIQSEKARDSFYRDLTVQTQALIVLNDLIDGTANLKKYDINQKDFERTLAEMNSKTRVHTEISYELKGLKHRPEIEDVIEALLAGSDQELDIQDKIRVYEQHLKIIPKNHYFMIEEYRNKNKPVIDSSGKIE